MTLIFLSRRLVRSSITLALVCCASIVIAQAQTPAGGVRAFMNEQVESERYVFPPGALPRINWQHEDAVGREIGRVPLSVTYYNARFEPVTAAAEPGRYGAVVEGRTASGFVVKRYVTLYCAPVEFDDYSMNVPVVMKELAGYGIDPRKWKRYADNHERFSFGSMKFFPEHDPDAAIFLAGLSEVDTVEANAANDDTPRLRDRQWWITLKHSIEHAPGPTVMLRAPASVGKKSFPADTGSGSSYESQKIEALRALCRQWAQEGGVPHVALVLHKDRIIFHEAFGAADDGPPVTTDAKMWMASITKLLTGTLMMEFVDQGLIDLDRPVGAYLPELRADSTLTIRRLLTHTSGLAFAGEWASDWNQALDNQVAQVAPTVQEEEHAFSYNRVGYALAAKILERITDAAVPTLFKRYLFLPLGMESAYADNSYGGLYCTTLDLARFAEVLLHKGTFEGCTLFSETSFDRMLPATLPKGGGGKLWGIGTTPFTGHGLSPKAFGHGAASGTVLRIDPGQELIIISARNRPSKRQGEFEWQFIERATVLVKGK